jgi:hypothetical protein
VEDIVDHNLSKFPFALVTADRTMTSDRAMELLRTNLAAIGQELSVRAPNALVTSALKVQLAWLRSGHFCSFGGRVYEFDQRTIVDEVAHLENPDLPTSTKAHEPMSGMLSGLWHKHFFEARFLPKNCGNEMQKNFERLWHRDFLPAWQSDLALQDETDVGRLTGLIAQTMVHGAFLNRLGNRSPQAKSRVTGELIIFGKNEGRNVYLTLAVHEESNAAIATRIWQCGQEFPFILDILKSNGVEISFVP